MRHIKLTWVEWLGEAAQAALGGLFFGMLVGFAFTVWLGYMAGRDDMRQQALDRNLATHCPEDGRWAWNGECEK